jgi:hypothetical protein
MSGQHVSLLTAADEIARLRREVGGLRKALSEMAAEKREWRQTALAWERRWRMLRQRSNAATGLVVAATPGTGRANGAG